MERQLPGPYWTCTRTIGQLCYRSIDGRFEVRNTWRVDSIREPHWLLMDLATGHSYRFFVRQQMACKIKDLLAQDGHPEVGSGKRG